MILLIVLLIFVLTLGAGLLGLWVHKTLPAEQKNDSARAVVGQVAGLVTLLLALVLGTVIGTATLFRLPKDRARDPVVPDPAARSGARPVRAGDQARPRKTQGFGAGRLRHLLGRQGAGPEAIVGGASARFRPGDQGLPRLPKARPTIRSGPSLRPTCSPARSSRAAF